MINLYRFSFQLEEPKPHKPDRTLWLIDNETKESTPVADMKFCGASHKHNYLAQQVAEILDTNIDEFDQDHLEIMHI